MHMQAELAPRYVCAEHLKARRLLNLNEHSIPTLNELDDQLRACSGWGLVKARGYVQPRAFFQLLKQKLFPCNDLIRHHTELDYTSEPDLWHDIMGHLPMLADPVFGEFNHLFGRVGVNVRNDEQSEILDKVYWFSMEFGIINPGATTDAVGPLSSARVYGAATVAAVGEMVMSLSESVERRPFSISAVSKGGMDVARVNHILFEIPSFESLLDQFTEWARSERLL
jgi:phenylalanine-4-hydroxylase